MGVEYELKYRAPEDTLEKLRDAFPGHWLETAMERSAFESEVVPTVEDRVITISTCSDSAAKTRFVLLGVLR